MKKIVLLPIVLLYSISVLSVDQKSAQKTSAEDVFYVNSDDFESEINVESNDGLKLTNYSYFINLVKYKKPVTGVPVERLFCAGFDDGTTHTVTKTISGTITHESEIVLKAKISAKYGVSAEAPIVENLVCKGYSDFSREFGAQYSQKLSYSYTVTSSSSYTMTKNGIWALNIELSQANKYTLEVDCNINTWTRKSKKDEWGRIDSHEYHYYEVDYYVPTDISTKTVYLRHYDSYEQLNNESEKYQIINSVSRNIFSD